MKDFIKNCCNAVNDKQFYIYCTLGNIMSYVKNVDWGMVLSTFLMLLGIVLDWQKKLKRKREQEEEREREIAERLNIVRKKNEKELELKIDENEILKSTIDKLFNKIDEKDNKINELLTFIQNKEFKDVWLHEKRNKAQKQLAD